MRYAPFLSSVNFQFLNRNPRDRDCTSHNHQARCLEKDVQLTAFTFAFRSREDREASVIIRATARIMKYRVSGSRDVSSTPETWAWKYSTRADPTRNNAVKNGRVKVARGETSGSARSGNISRSLMVASGGEEAIYSMDTDGRLRGG